DLLIDQKPCLEAELEWDGELFHLVSKTTGQWNGNDCIYITTSTTTTTTTTTTLCGVKTMWSEDPSNPEVLEGGGTQVDCVYAMTSDCSAAQGRTAYIYQGSCDGGVQQSGPCTTDASGMCCLAVTVLPDPGLYEYVGCVDVNYDGVMESSPTEYVLVT
ncbi:MAG: hypothetical protein V1744_07130, partial [Candidatus Altiarchaeota archaeon]